MFDVIVIGGGPAGLSAALTLGRALRTTLLIDSGEYRNAPAAEMHNFLTRDGTPPAELRALAREELARYPTVQIRNVAVDQARQLEAGGFELALADGDSVQARRLVLATGLADDLPPIEGIEDLWGRGVYHCPYCHGYEVKDTTIAVLGSDPVMVDLSLHLRRFSDDVVLCVNGRGDDLDEATRTRLATYGVPVRAEKVVRLESSGDELERIVFESGDPLPRRALFAIGQFGQRSPIPDQLGCRLLPDGCVEVTDFHQTSVAGVYAAGDMAHRPTMPGPTPFVIVATAGGTIAAIAADKDLVATDTPVPTA
ncbi:NAD(P)/FAD-dependent oxidoreductase [Micromonospora sp. PLK6-60]|uniref:NAD(P)/FAD-dependent oxidoreductase n=1 Tax=Micromonospora sp. PLK6-60 TaxID=2873383 RepID=UPI001CA67192|nr:NAD(P)/FAD-dependent oxidoreductase [Micromonospora sp. PLK6-60]MBY8870770.1 NAD(P)/FAD-dependent oxidoreductase [Micromonospora sp. PLK6-60]